MAKIVPTILGIDHAKSEKEGLIKPTFCELSESIRNRLKHICSARISNMLNLKFQQIEGLADAKPHVDDLIMTLWHKKSRDQSEEYVLGTYLLLQVGTIKYF